MKFIFYSTYILGVIFILLSLIQIFTLGWAWQSVIKIGIAVLWMTGNYFFMRQTGKDQNIRNKQSQKK